MAGWEENLQTLFISIEGLENPQQAKINDDLDIFMAKWVDGVQALRARSNYPGKEEQTTFRVKYEPSCLREISRPARQVEKS